MRFLSFAAALALFLVSTFTGVDTSPVNLASLNKRIHPLYVPGRQSVGASDPILFHGGPVLTGTLHTYAIFYGTWSSSAEKILTDFLHGISNTTYFNIEKTYHDKNGKFIQGPIHFRKKVMDNYSKGKALADQDILDIVGAHIASGEFPSEKNAVYFVFTSPDVDETSGFCTQYCGWHDSGIIGSTDIKYSFIGNPLNCLAGCSPNNQKVSPNNNPGVDAMVSVVAHELMEAVSDPDVLTDNAWSDASGQENADKCAYIYGHTSTSSNGAVYNIAFGGRQYLIQQNWDAKTQRCESSTN